MKFVVDKSKWRRGGTGLYAKGDGQIRLLNHEGYMCCLGFCALQIGATRQQIFDKPYPGQVGADLGPLTGRWGETIHNTMLSQRAASINDDTDITDDGRIEQLTALFQEYGHEIEFIGGDS